MKKGVIITLGIVLSVLLIFIGVNKIKLNKPTSTQSVDHLNYEERKAVSSARTQEEKEKERIEIKDIGKSKYQSIIILQNLNPKKPTEDYGTGFIVSKNKVLTTKHVADTFNSTTVACLRNEKGEFVDFKIKNVVNAPNYTDLSIVEIAPNDNGQNIGDNIKTLEFATQEEINNVKVGDMINIVGYPRDKNFSTLWYSEGKVLYLPPNNIGVTYLDTLTEGGNSGSPILNSDGKIIGLNNGGTELKNPKTRISLGFLLDKELYEFIIKNI